jgi:hypothetical protein
VFIFQVKISEYYLNLAKRNPALMNLVKARPEETDDLTSGEADPSNQNRLEGANLDPVIADCLVF